MENQEQNGLPREVQLSLVFVAKLIALMGHKHFMAPPKPKEMEHWPNCTEWLATFIHWTDPLHHGFHSVMGIIIPIILIVLAIRVGKLLVKSRKKQGGINNGNSK